MHTTIHAYIQPYIHTNNHTYIQTTIQPYNHAYIHTFLCILHIILLLTHLRLEGRTLLHQLGRDFQTRRALLDSFNYSLVAPFRPKVLYYRLMGYVMCIRNLKCGGECNNMPWTKDFFMYDISFRPPHWPCCGAEPCTAPLVEAAAIFTTWKLVGCMCVRECVCACVRVCMCGKKRVC